MTALRRIGGMGSAIMGGAGRMTANKYFRWKWKELAGKSCLYVAPLEIVNNQRWITFFKEVTGTFPDGEVNIFVDVRDIEDTTGMEGFKEIIDIFKEQGVESVSSAVITSDKNHDLTANLFRAMAGISDFKLQIEVFFNEDLARSWMVERIGGD